MSCWMTFVGFLITVVPTEEIAWIMCFFFFQAEDGIRDWTVTGVQTCALPILFDAGTGRELRRWRAVENPENPWDITELAFRPGGRHLVTAGWGPVVRVWDAATEIGRASCRERV